MLISALGKVMLHVNIEFSVLNNKSLKLLAVTLGCL